MADSGEQIAGDWLKEHGIYGGFTCEPLTGCMSAMLTVHSAISFNDYEVYEADICDIQRVLHARTLRAIKACRAKLDEIEKGLDNG